MVEYNGKEVVIMACSACNIKRCKHCYISYSGNRTADNLYDLTNTLKHKYKVYINGAEILTNYNYLRSYVECKQDWLLTNGYAIAKDPTVINLLKYNGIDKVEMSYHFGIQNNISAVDEDVLNNAIKRVLSNGLKLKLLVTINSQNYNKIQEICNRAVEIGAYGIEFTMFLNQGNARAMDPSNLLKEEQRQTFFEQLRMCRKNIPKEKLIIDRSGIFGKDKDNSKCHFNCPAGRDLVVITPDNNVYPCLFLAKKGFEIGKYIDKKILLYYNIKNLGNKCIAEEICNKNNKKIFDELRSL